MEDGSVAEFVTKESSEDELLMQEASVQEWLMKEDQGLWDLMNIHIK